MLKIDEIITEVESLPIEMKTELISKLLTNLTPPNKEVDRLWAIEAEKRLKDITSGKVKSIPGEDVHNEIMKKFNR